MIKVIVDILNARLETTGRIDRRYCLAENRERSKDKASIPYAYQGKGELKAVDIGNPSLSWWKLTDKASFTEAPTTASVNKMVGTYPLRLVVMFRRKDSTKDDSFSPSWLAEDISQLLTFSNGDLKTALKASDVRVNVSSTDFNTTSVWNEEFENLQFTDPKYKTALVALELSVVVTGLKSCWENECDYDNDILHIFDFCKQGVVDRLTDAQQQCLIDALCTCADASIEINGTPFTTVASGATYDQAIHDSAGSDVGTNANPSVVSDTTVQNNATPTWSDTVEAEGTITLAQAKALDSDGSTDLLANYIPSADGHMFTCTPATAVPYERPSDWLDLPSIEASDQQFSALVAVWDAYGNPLTFKFTCDSGDYDVDWGDGNTETVTSGTWAEHIYDYADVDDLTSRGYRQAIVTVTPTTGGSVFTAVNLNQKHTALANAIRYSTPLLDIRMAGSSISSWTVRNINGNTGIYFDYLEQFEWVGANSITNAQYFFFILRVLKKVVALDTSNFTSFKQFHYDNRLLVETPTYDTSSANDLSSMFYLCYSIPVVKVTDMSGATTIKSMFLSTY